MKKLARFTKMHGAGNDYIYIDTTRQSVPNPSETAIRLSQRHTGVGGDGLVLIGSADKQADADFSMRIFNSDGSEAMMCGNAARCIGKYVYDRGLCRKTTIRLQALSGMKILQLHTNTEGSVDSVTVDMLAPSLTCPAQYNESCGGRLSANNHTFSGTFVSMDNPHFVIFVDNMQDFDVESYGKSLETNDHVYLTGGAEFVFDGEILI